MTPHSDRVPVKCSQCYKDRWFAHEELVPEPFICWQCERHNEISEGLRRSPRPAA